MSNMETVTDNTQDDKTCTTIALRRSFTAFPIELLNEIINATHLFDSTTDSFHPGSFQRSDSLLCRVNKQMYSIISSNRRKTPVYQNFGSYPTVTGKLTEDVRHIVLAYPPSSASHLSDLVDKLRSLPKLSSTGLTITFGKTFFKALDDTLHGFWERKGREDSRFPQPNVEDLLHQTIRLLTTCNVRKVIFTEPPNEKGSGRRGLYSLRKNMHHMTSTGASRNGSKLENVIFFDENHPRDIIILGDRSMPVTVIFSSHVGSPTSHRFTGEQLFRQFYIASNALIPQFTFVNRVGNKVMPVTDLYHTIERGVEGTDEVDILKHRVYKGTWNGWLKIQLSTYWERQSGYPRSKDVRIVDISEVHGLLD